MLKSMSFSRLVKALMFIVCGLLVAPSLVPAMGHGEKKPAKKAILLVTFGTSIPRAQKIFEKIDAAYKKAFPGAEIRWAYTSKIIRNKLAKHGKIWLSPEEALAKLMAQDYNQIAVQSLHFICGEEYHDLVGVVHGFKGMTNDFRALIGNPLCATTEDLQAVAKAALADLPKERKKDEAIVYMGHGTPHPGGVAYPALDYVLQSHDHLLILGTVEGWPELKDVKAYLLKHKVKRAYLIPFMTVAGDHATNDMAGPEPDSWKSVLTKAGIACVPVMKPVADNPEIIKIWIEHTRKVLKRFK
jgi:sirohydrochlorin cobaltochelatase